MSATTTLSGFLSGFNRRRSAAGACVTIDSINAIVEPRRLVLPAGCARRLAAGGRFRVATGRVWLTHRGDGRDWFPPAGAVFRAGPASVVEALGDAVLEVL